MIFVRNAFKNTFLFLCIIFISCVSGIKSPLPSPEEAKTDHIPAVNNDSIPIVLVGANQTDLYIPILKNKKIGIVGNQTSVIFKDSISNHRYTHLVDSLLSRGIIIEKIFAPEHGFRGKSDAGEWVADGKDIKTGLPIISLHGKSKKPTKESLSGIDIVIFDIQDVGVRFYTYIATLQHMMQACAENNIPILILDRPNPNGHYIDGPILEKKHASFLGLNPIPLVHGLTIGEYAKMVNQEGWLDQGVTCEITVIPVKNYTHDTPYSLPIRPSPNLPNDHAINLYPSLGFFEGTTINAGRGTEMQFQIFGSPDLNIEKYDYAYTPNPNFGAKYPKHNGEVCYGKNLQSTVHLDSINLQWLIDAYHNTNTKEKFFKTKSFTLHAGTEKLQQQIQQGLSFEKIKNSWQEGLKNYKAIRKKYVLYP